MSVFLCEIYFTYDQYLISVLPHTSMIVFKSEIVYVNLLLAVQTTSPNYRCGCDNNVEIFYMPLQKHLLQVHKNFFPLCVHPIYILYGFLFYCFPNCTVSNAVSRINFCFELTSH